MTEKPKPKPEMTVQPLIDLLNQFTGLVKMFPLKFLQVTPAIKERQFAMGTVPLPNDIVYDDVKSLAKWNKVKNSKELYKKRRKNNENMDRNGI